MEVDGKINVIEMISGDTAPISIECKNPENDQPIDISASNFTNIIFTVSNKNKILIQKSIGSGISYVTDGTDGRLTITLDTHDTTNLKGIYSYDMQFESVGSAITTPVKSFFVVKEDIT